MPPKNKRQLQLMKAREAKRQRIEAQTEDPVLPVSPETQSQPSTSSASENTTAASSSPNLDVSNEGPSLCEEDKMKAYLEEHIESWVCSLSRDDCRSLAMTLHYALVTVNKVKNASELIGSIIGKSERTVREWRYSFFNNDGEFQDSQQGKYQREGVLWHNEELNEAASDYVRANAVVKGHPNMTSISFCHWVNETLLPNSILDPGYPRSVSVQTARLWLHELGFEVLDKKKGVYIDGHEREDVVSHRRKFLRQLIAGGFLTPELAPSTEAKEAFPDDLDPPTLPRREKNIFIFHDESTFNANDDESLQWGTADSQIIRPKSRGSGMMVSDFITEKDGFLCLTEAEHKKAQRSHPGIPMGARTLLEYGERRDGYWTSPKFMKQMKNAVSIAEAKYPKEDGYRLFWVFDQSSCHMAFADDALNASRMNASPGGAQPLMHDFEFQGKYIRMTREVIHQGKKVRIACGTIEVLKQLGKYRESPKMKLDEMKEILGKLPNFTNEKNQLEYFLHECGHACLFIPKYHCELNPIERCWSQAKRYTRAYCNYNINGLRRNVVPALDSISLENIQNYFRRARNYMYGYLLGHKAGIQLEKLIQKYSKEFKSHRRIPESD